MKELKGKTLVLYTYGLCNLDCVYCYIDKSEALIKIDNALKNSFLDNYYFDFSKEVFKKEELTEMQFWGGEPSLGLPRTYHLIPLFIDYYPKLKTFMMSTNFTTLTWQSDFFNFLKILGNFPERKFIFSLQLSIDGPEKINDKNRGFNTTKLFLKNYDIFIKNLNENLVPDNVDLKFHFKPTLSLEILQYMVENKQNIIDYYQFFDNLLDKFYTDSIPKKNISFMMNLPNFATPSPTTIQDGKNFTIYCKLAKEIEDMNLFKYYKSLSIYKRNNNMKKICYNDHCGTCGTGTSVVGLLPEHKLSMCHNGFTDISEQYKILCEQNQTWKEKVVQEELFSNITSLSGFCIDFDKYKDYLYKVNSFFEKNSTFKQVNLVNTIRILAKEKQIESKYQNEKEALKAADYLTSVLPFCIRDNITTTGSMALQPVGFIKLLLNGAEEYLNE